MSLPKPARAAVVAEYGKPIEIRSCDGGRAAVFAPLETGRRADAVVRRLADGIALGLLAPNEQLPSESELEPGALLIRVDVASICGSEHARVPRDQAARSPLGGGLRRHAVTIRVCVRGHRDGRLDP